MAHTPYTTAQWRALGSDCTLVFFDEREVTNHNLVDLADTVIAVTEEFEHRFSRFLSTSELTHFNQHEGGTFVISDELYQLLSEAKRMHEHTDGFFDPTVIAALKKYQYIVAETTWPLSAPSLQVVPPHPPFSELKLEKNRRVSKPSGLEIDLGGIGKSFLLRQLRDTALHGVTHYYLSLGGDLITKGSDGEHDGWRIEIDSVNPDQAPVHTLVHGSGSLCTSGTARRYGTTGQQPWHHIIDPQTGDSLRTPVLAATALGDDPIWTEQIARLALKEYEILDQQWLRDHDCAELWLQFATTITHYTA